MFEIKIEPNTNLLEETLYALRFFGESPENVLFVTDGENYYSFQEFVEDAKDINYYDGYYLIEINSELKIVGKDFWLERGHDDGAEWWSFKRIPKKENYTYSNRLQIKEKK